MNEREAIKRFHERCSSFLDASEAEEIVHRLLESLTGLGKWERRMNPSVTIDEARFEQMLNELQTAKPVQYILGEEWFCNLRLIVNEHVLIPRPETEELVKWMTRESTALKSPAALVLDIGTGSGCIALAIKHAMQAARVMGYDLSEDALRTARLNAKNLNLDVNFLQADILDPDLDPGTCFDVIVSNPPYITAAEQDAMDDRVLRFEPHAALFVTNNDPLQFYKAIGHFAGEFLHAHGELYLELNRDFALEAKALYEKAGFLTELRKDMYGQFRMLKAIKKPAIT